MAVAFYVLPHNNALPESVVPPDVGPGEWRPSIKSSESGFAVRLNSIAVKNATSEADASKRFLDWVREAGWSAVDALLDMKANPYDVHTVATCVAAHLNDWSRSFGVVQRIQDLYIDDYAVYTDPYSPVQFRFLSERRRDEIIVSLRTPVMMRDRWDDDIGSTPFSSLAPALSRTDAAIYVKSGSDVGVLGDYSPPTIEWFIDDAVESGMRIFNHPGTVTFTYPDDQPIIVALPGDDSIIGIDADDTFAGIDTLYQDSWEWSTALLKRSMFYVPKREKPAIALYDDIIAWMHRSVGVRSDDFDRSLEALRKALVDLLDIEVDMECDEMIASSERFYDILDDLLLNGCDTITVLRRTERGLLVLASDSSARTDRRKLYFALGRGW